VLDSSDDDLAMLPPPPAKRVQTAPTAYVPAAPTHAPIAADPIEYTPLSDDSADAPRPLRRTMPAVLGGGGGGSGAAARGRGVQGLLKRRR
jgi:hypothetical protein